MALLSFDNNSPRALLAVMTVMSDPGFAQHLPAEAAIPFLAVPAVFLICVAALEFVRVRRCAHGYHRPSRFHVVDHVPHLFVRQVAEAGEYDAQVARVQGLGTW